MLLRSTRSPRHFAYAVGLQLFVCLSHRYHLPLRGHHTWEVFDEMPVLNFCPFEAMDSDMEYLNSDTEYLNEHHIESFDEED